MKITITFGNATITLEDDLIIKERKPVEKQRGIEKKIETFDTATIPRYTCVDCGEDFFQAGKGRFRHCPECKKRKAERVPADDTRESENE